MTQIRTWLDFALQQFAGNHIFIGFSPESYS